MTHTEGELHFDFSTAKSVEKLDAMHQKKAEGWKLVDFVIEEPNRIILVEIKDPSCAPKTDSPEAHAHLAKERQAFAQKIKDRTLISKELTPKARDSYCFLHLMRRDTKPFLYVVLLGAAKLMIDAPLLLSMKERLLDALRQEADVPWAREYVMDCVVLTESTWGKAFPGYPMIRKSPLQV